jgi:hypothetical protein
MGFMDWFRTKDARANHDFNDKDRELSKEIRRQRAEIASLKMQHEIERERVHHELEMSRLQQQLEDMQPEDDDEPEEKSTDPMDVMMMAILSKMTSNSPAVVPNTNTEQIKTTVPLTTAGVSLTDEQINDYWDNMPKFQKVIARKATDEQIKNLLQNKIPGINEDSISRCIATIRGT